MKLILAAVYKPEGDVRLFIQKLGDLITTSNAFNADVFYHDWGF